MINEKCDGWDWKDFGLLVHVVVLEFGIEIFAVAADHPDHVETDAAEDRENHHQQREDGVARSIATALDHRDATSGTSEMEKVHGKFRG